MMTWRGIPPRKMLLLLLSGMAMSGVAQSDREVTTVRERGVVPLPHDAKISNQPRYYLDTVDTLSRQTTDESRTAPGLAKNNYVPKIYPIYNTNAIEIQSYLLRSLAYEGGVVEVMGLEGVKDASGRAVQYLFVTAPDFMIPGITEIVELADRPGFKFFDATGLDFGAGPGAVQYVGKHRTASELVAILMGTELGNIGAFLFPPFADDSTNTIYVVENPTDIADSLAALEMFDVPPLQVEIEVKIYEIADGDRSKLGLDWDSWKRFVSGDFTFTDSSSKFFLQGEKTYETMLSLNALALTEFLNYTVQTGTANLLTTARLTMVNSEDLPGALTGGARGTATGTPAVVSTMTALPYVRTLGTNELRNDWADLTPVEEGVRLEILPFIGSESTTLKIAVTVNSLVGFSGEENVPIIASRETSSVVNLFHGESLVLSGFKKQQHVSSKVGLPILKDIPVLGLLFSKEVKDTTGSELLISLKPTIKRSDSAALSALPVGF